MKEEAGGFAIRRLLAVDTGQSKCVDVSWHSARSTRPFLKAPLQGGPQVPSPHHGRESWPHKCLTITPTVLSLWSHQCLKSRTLLFKNTICITTTYTTTIPSPPTTMLYTPHYSPHVHVIRHQNPHHHHQPHHHHHCLYHSP